jgi:hypothetical protein
MKQLMRQTEYARHRGVSAAAVSRAIREGRITVQADGRIDPVAADAQWEANTRKRADPRSQPIEASGVSAGHSQAGEETYLAARTRREQAEAHLAELRVRQACGELVSAAEVRTEMAVKISALRDRFLNIGARLAPVLAAETDPQRCQIAIDAEVCETLASFCASLDREASPTSSASSPTEQGAIHHA